MNMHNPMKLLLGNLLVLVHQLLLPPQCQSKKIHKTLRNNIYLGLLKIF